MSEAAPAIPGYSSLAAINAGGSSIIYSAHDDRHGRSVAIKVLTTKSLDPSLRQSFDRELKAMGRLSDHPHIMAIHDSGFTTDGSPYLVMPLFSQGSYANLINTAGPVGQVEFLDSAIKILSALETAHQRSTLHRDIKPENMFVGHYRSQPVLGDFGISTFLDSGRTTTKAVAYTLTYAAPEVLDGNRQTHLSDIYSLGLAFRYLLSGVTPHRGEAASQLISHILTKPPAPLPPDLPNKLRDLLDQMVDKEPDRRPQACLEIAQRFQQLQSSPTPLLVDQETSQADLETNVVSPADNHAPTPAPSEAPTTNESSSFPPTRKQEPSPVDDPSEHAPGWNTPTPSPAGTPWGHAGVNQHVPAPIPGAAAQVPAASANRFEQPTQSANQPSGQDQPGPASVPTSPQTADPRPKSANGIVIVLALLVASAIPFAIDGEDLPGYPTHLADPAMLLGAASLGSNLAYWLWANRSASARFASLGNYLGLLSLIVLTAHGKELVWLDRFLTSSDLSAGPLEAWMPLLAVAPDDVITTQSYVLYGLWLGVVTLVQAGANLARTIPPTLWRWVAAGSHVTVILGVLCRPGVDTLGKTESVLFQYFGFPLTFAFAVVVALCGLLYFVGQPNTTTARSQA